MIKTLFESVFVDVIQSLSVSVCHISSAAQLYFYIFIYICIYYTMSIPGHSV